MYFSLIIVVLETISSLFHWKHQTGENVYLKRYKRFVGSIREIKKERERLTRFENIEKLEKRVKIVVKR